MVLEEVVALDAEDVAKEDVVQMGVGLHFGEEDDADDGVAENAWHISLSGYLKPSFWHALFSRLNRLLFL